MAKKQFNLTFLFIFLLNVMHAQNYELHGLIENQPQNQIILAKIKGDKIVPIDSFSVQTTKTKMAEVVFDLENYSVGMYRLILGQTTYAKIMNEPPQQIDFLFNNENFSFETDFNAPSDSLKIIQSEENKVWFNFLRKENDFQQKLKIAEMEVNYYQEQNLQNKKDGFNNVAALLKSSVKSYNQIQKHRDSVIAETIKENQSLFVAKLIRNYQEPFLDGNFLEQERNSMFETEFLQKLDFSDETLLNTPVLNKKVFQFFMHFAKKGLSREQQEMEFIRAADMILKHIETVNSANPIDKVYEFILDYLLRGFEKLQLNNAVIYMAENYSGTTCQTDEKSTLKRKLEAIKMKVGTEVADFEMNDFNGDKVKLSDIQKDTTLLIFWASWCPHCTEILPQIKSWSDTQKSENIEIVAVSLDTSKTDWQNCILQNKLESFYNFCDFKEWDGKTTLDYNIYATPTIFIIDRNRKILAKPFLINSLFAFFRH